MGCRGGYQIGVCQRCYSELHNCSQCSGASRWYAVRLDSQKGKIETTVGTGGAVFVGPWVFFGVWRLIDLIGRTQTTLAMAPYLAILASPIAFVIEFIGAVGLLYYATTLEQSRESKAAPRIIRPYSESTKPKRHWFWLKVAIAVSVLSSCGAVLAFLFLRHPAPANSQVAARIVTNANMPARPQPEQPQKKVSQRVGSRFAQQHPIPKQSPDSTKPTELAATPAAAPVQSSAIISVQESTGSPVSGARVLLVSANGTHTPVGLTDATGRTRVATPGSTSVEVYCAHVKFPAYHKSGYDPTTPLQIVLGAEPGVGSLISIGEGYIEIPGLDGGWDPRTYPSSYSNAGEHYVYTRNLSVNGHVETFFPFKAGQNLMVEDNKGHRVELKLVTANAECFLMQYKRL